MACCSGLRAYSAYAVLYQHPHTATLPHCHTATLPHCHTATLAVLPFTQLGPHRHELAAPPTHPHTPTVQVDDVLAEKVINEEPISSKDLKEAIRRAVVALRFQPVFLGSAFKNKGVQVGGGWTGWWPAGPGGGLLC
jgi:hypothetical protein